LSPFSGRLLSKLVSQLVPAVLIAGVGMLALGNLTKAPSAKPEAAPVVTAINAEAVVRLTPREAIEPQAEDAKPVKVARTPANKPKPVAASAAPVRTAANEPPHQTAPLPIAPATPQVAEPVVSDGSMMGRLRGAAAAVQRIPQWTARAVSGWWPEGEPPRPPAAIPVEFQASM
jgi:hypothetical protein